MNERIISNLKGILSNPDILNGTKEERDEVLEILQDAVNGKEPSMSQMLKVSMASDIDLKSMFSMVYLPEECFRESMLLDLIRKEDMEKIYYIVSNYIFIKDGKYYLAIGWNLRERNLLSEHTIQILIELLIRKGYPLNARHISSKQVYYQPSCLDVPGISRINLLRYMFGRWGIEVPFIDEVTIDMINGLNPEDIDMILGMVVQAYRQFHAEYVYDDSVTIKIGADEVWTSIYWTDFSRLRTESSAKDELINLQNQIFKKNS